MHIAANNKLFLQILKDNSSVNSDEQVTITKKEIQQIETDALLDKVFNGSLGNFLTEYLKNQQSQYQPFF